MPTSPRRSSRALRGLTQPPTHQAHSNSSSSTSSQRAERNTRSLIKQGSPQKSLTPNSLLSEELSEHATNDAPLARRSKRQQDHEGDMNTKAEDEMEEETGDGEGAIRCVCGFSDYPGPATDGQPEPQIDFVMCDSCNQWQHGGCVGIFDESTNPEEYFCEECKPALHQVARGREGQRYSHYLPIFEKTHARQLHRKGSATRAVEPKIAKDKDKNARVSMDALTKRRSTMNSRAAYDEEEVLRKVLEESKTEGAQPHDTASRKSKRSREESEDARTDTKRRRTRSDTPSSSRSDDLTPSGELDDRAKVSKKAAARGVAAKTQREKELREREKERAAAASKRQGRAERRRVDEPDPTDESSKPSNGKSPQDDPPGSQPPDTPSSTTMNHPAPRRGGRPSGKRGGRGGRNPARDAETPTINDHTSPTRRAGKTSASPKDANGNDGTGSGADSGAGVNNNGGASSRKGRQQQPRDPSMTELKKKAAAMMDYIAQTQIELARWNERGIGSAAAPLYSGTTSISEAPEDITKQMGDLSTKLVKWQEEFGKWPEK